MWQVGTSDLTSDLGTSDLGNLPMKWPPRHLRLLRIINRHTTEGHVSNGGLVHCRLLAPKYGVTPKTIRDVWSGRTWAEATRHLWTPEEKAQRDRPKAKSGPKPDTDDGSDADEDESDADARKRPKKDEASQLITPT